MLSDKEREQRLIEAHCDEFINLCNPFGGLDIKHAVEQYLTVGKTARDLFGDCEDFCEDAGTNFNDLDVCHVAYSTIFEQARDKIDNSIYLDLYDVGFVIFGNYCDTSIDYSDDDYNELLEKLAEHYRDVNKAEIEELFEDEACAWFFEQIDLSLEDVEGYKVEEVEEE